MQVMVLDGVRITKERQVQAEDAYFSHVCMYVCMFINLHIFFINKYMCVYVCMYVCIFYQYNALNESLQEIEDVHQKAIRQIESQHQVGMYVCMYVCTVLYVYVCISILYIMYMYVSVYVCA